MTDPVRPLSPGEYAKEYSQKKGYIHRTLVGFDDFVNVILDGNPDETISSRMARWATEDTGLKKAIGTAVCSGLNIVNSDHGAKAMASDLGRADRVYQIEKADPIIQKSESD